VPGAAAYFMLPWQLTSELRERGAQRVDVILGRVPGTHEAGFARAGRAPGIEAKLLRQLGNARIAQFHEHLLFEITKIVEQRELKLPLGYAFIDASW